MIDFEFKTEPLEHQLENFLKHSGDDAHGLLWTMGTGKTWIAIQHAARLYAEGKIDAVLVLAPGGVHDNWHTKELPKHCPLRYLSFAWASRKAKAKHHEASTSRLMIYPHLAFLLMSYDGFMTPLGQKYALEFLEKRRVLWILDESHLIKNIDSKRSQKVTLHGKGVKYKRILTGTPTTGSPFDLYTQLWFLDQNFWKRHGFAKYQPFKNYFGKWRQRIIYEADQELVPKGKKKIKARFRELVMYRNVDKLHDMIMELCSRETKDVLDLPPQFYHKWEFELAPRQQELYDQLRDEFLTFLDSGEMITATMVTTRLLRLQQITCGYLPSDDCESLNFLPENPRLDYLIDILKEVDDQVIIFARFRPDIDQICARLGDTCVRYDGAISQDERNRNETLFTDGERRYFVGNPAACSMGLTLVCSATVVYYSNSFMWVHREQSESRPHRMGQTRAVTYIDMMAKGTVDFHIAKSLRGKNDIATSITGDEVRKWL